MKVLWFFVAIIFCFWFFRTVPLGMTTVNYSEEASELSIARPRYLIPREIHFSGWPLPGGGFHIVKDPSIDASAPGRFSLPAGAGSIAAMAFTVNSHFENRFLRENIILVIDHSHGTKIEYDLQELDLSVAHSGDTVFIVSVSESSLYLYLLLYRRGEEWGETLVKLPRWKSGKAIYASISEEVKWNELVSELLPFAPNDFQAQICKSQTIPVLDFWTKALGKKC